MAAADPDFMWYGVGSQNVRDARAAESSQEHEIIHRFADELKEPGIDLNVRLVLGGTVDTILG